MNEVKIEWKVVILAFSVGYFLIALVHESFIVVKLTSWNEKRRLRIKKKKANLTLWDYFMILAFSLDKAFSIF